MKVNHKNTYQSTCTYSFQVANQKTIIEKGVPLLLENLKEADTPAYRTAILSAFADVTLIKGAHSHGL